MPYKIITFCVLLYNVASFKLLDLNPLKNSTKLFFPQVTVSKFPPVVEGIVQRIQAQHSNYVYEDMSRPVNNPNTYTLSPEEEEYFGLVSSTTEQVDENIIVDEEDTEKVPYSIDFENDCDVNETDSTTIISSSRNCKEESGETTVPNLIEKDETAVISTYGLPNIVYKGNSDIDAEEALRRTIRMDSVNVIEDENKITPLLIHKDESGEALYQKISNVAHKVLKKDEPVD